MDNQEVNYREVDSCYNCCHSWDNGHGCVELKCLLFEEEANLSYICDEYEHY